MLSACTAALAHGGNDVGNAMGPLVLIWLIFKVGHLSSVESIFVAASNNIHILHLQDPLEFRADSKYYFLLLYGSMGIALGLVLYGSRRVLLSAGGPDVPRTRRVITMMGSRVTRRMTSSMGFCVEWVAAVTVLIASLEAVAIPVSTTHCQIGGVVGAGLVRL